MGSIYKNGIPYTSGIPVDSDTGWTQAYFGFVQLRKKNGVLYVRMDGFTQVEYAAALAPQTWTEVGDLPSEFVSNIVAVWNGTAQMNGSYPQVQFSIREGRMSIQSDNVIPVNTRIRSSLAYPL